MKKITGDWLEAARDDLLIIHEIISNPQLTNMVAFHSQQCIEKCLKAILEEFENKVPRIHNLERLLALTSKYIEIPGITITVIEEMDKLYTESRYPGELGLLPEGKPSIDDANTFYEHAQLVYDHVHQLL